MINVIIGISIDCMGMNTPNYEALNSSNTSWICCQCGLPNFASSLFSNFTFEVSNSFTSLTTLSNDSSLPLSPPAATSSPKLSGHSNVHNHSSHSANRETNRRKHSLERQSIKAMVFNFDGI